MEEQNSKHEPLLANKDEDQNNLLATTSSFTSSFMVDENDIQPINGVKDFFREFFVESRKLWLLAGPAVFTSVCQYSLGAIVQVFAGHVGTVELAALSVENSVIAGFSLGIMLGMGSALETLCGQAFGAGQVEMLGIYMQRSWVILNCTSLVLMFLYIFAGPLLKLIGQTTAISETAGTFAIWMIPQLFAYSINFPMAKFLQSQSKMMVMTWIAFGAVILLTIFSWLFMLKLGWGLVGAAVVLNVAWVLIDVSQFIYIVSGSCGQAWTGFSFKAFENLWGFVRLSLASAVMLCLEMWYYMALILLAGYLENAEIAVAAISIWLVFIVFAILVNGLEFPMTVNLPCSANIVGWTVMISLGFNVAVSVRVSNELGAAHPRTAKFSVVVASIASTCVGIILCVILITTRNYYPYIFSDDEEVIALVNKLTPLLAFCIFINNVQPVLSGVAVGAGWQAFVAYVNIGCYYLLGIPLGLVFGFVLDLGIEGIWGGMIIGTIIQTCILFIMIYRTNWNKEASIAGERIKRWGGPTQIIEDGIQT